MITSYKFADFREYLGDFKNNTILLHLFNNFDSNLYPF